MSVYVGKNLITNLKMSSIIAACGQKDLKFRKYIDKLLNKFYRSEWGIISPKDININKLMLELNFSGIIGIYRHKKYGLFMLSIPPYSDYITIEPVEDNGYKCIDITRGKVFPEYGDT